VAVQVVVWLLAVVVQVAVEQGSPLPPVVVVVAHRAPRLATWYTRTCWHLAGEESTRWCVVRAGSPAKPYEVVLKLDAKRPSDARLTLGGRPVEFHLARHSAGRPPAPPTRPMARSVTLGSFRRRRVGRVHGPSAVPRHPTATRTDTSSRREYDSRCAPRNVWLVVRIARRRERRQAGGGGGGGSQEADGRWQVVATPGGMGSLRQRREECEARATLERHRGAFGAPGRPLGRVRRRSAAHELLPKMSASQRVVRCTRGSSVYLAWK
jgi:hypothetical protein